MEKYPNRKQAPMSQPPRTPDTAPHRPPQSPMTVYVFLGCSSFCVTALVVVALTSGSTTAVGAIGAVWTATCSALTLKTRH